MRGHVHLARPVEGVVPVPSSSFSSSSSSSSSSPFPFLSLALLLFLLLASALSGCSEKRPEVLVDPGAAGGWPAVVAIWADGVEVARLTDAGTISALCTMLPPRDGEELVDRGSCTTRDRRLSGAVEDLVGAPQSILSGPRQTTWGEIKLLASR